MNGRVQKIIDFIPDCRTLADVGCDHGYIGAGALSENKAQFVWFCDISVDSLAKARRLMNCANCDFVCADGLTVDVDVAVIAGLGGREIADIVRNAVSLPRWLVLQPMKNQYELRKDIIEHYSIEKDIIFKWRNKFYTLILAELREIAAQTDVVDLFEIKAPAENNRTRDIADSDCCSDRITTKSNQTKKESINALTSNGGKKRISTESNQTIKESINVLTSNGGKKRISTESNPVENYTDLELKFGKSNLVEFGEDFMEYLRLEESKVDGFLKRKSDDPQLLDKKNDLLRVKVLSNGIS
ncbi:MAG: class I SAM-dependent methyltransferase [Clostridia bacterium]|nr:class I SAM-dependent methyltransferase [Clostridia bacterium]